MRWFKRQSGGVQTLIVACVGVLLLVLIAAAGDDGGQDGSATATTAADAAPAATLPREQEREAAEEPAEPQAQEVATAFQRVGLPTPAIDDTSADCVDELPGCVARVTSDAVTVLTFDTAEAAARHVRALGRGDAHRSGTQVLAFSEGTPRPQRAQYAAVLDAVVRGGDGRAAHRRVVVAQRRAAKRRAIARQRRIARQRAEARRIAEERRIAEAEAAPDPVAAAPDYSGMTCSEIGHSFTVPPGSDPEHDADNDGVACESQ
jgi:hypothetical protein